MKNKHMPAARNSPRQLRIIGGQWKRSTLNVVDGEGLRPTPDRVRETIFNWLHHLFGGNWTQRSCLDLFAGSGALGFEAASRGAAQVLLAEPYAPAFRQLQQAQEKLHAQQVALQRTDALVLARQLAAQGRRFDLIFLDPPFQHGWLARVLPLCAPLLRECGLVYAEAEFPLCEWDGVTDEGNWMAGWQVIRAEQAGSVYFHILQRSNFPLEMKQNQA